MMASVHRAVARAQHVDAVQIGKTLAQASLRGKPAPKALLSRTFNIGPQARCHAQRAMRLRQEVSVGRELIG